MRNYEVVASILYGQQVTIAIAVIEDGEATYTIGKLTAKEFLSYKSIFDVTCGVYNRESDRVRTESLLETLEEDGVQIYGDMYKVPALQLKFPKHEDMVEDRLLKYLKAFRLSITKHSRPFHTRFLDRMRPRNGYLIKRGGLDAS